MSAAYPAKWPVEISVGLRDVSAVTRRLDEVKWSPERPPEFEAIAGKFRMCATAHLGEARTEQAIEMIRQLRRADRLRPLLAVLTKRQRRATR